jgi:hypothetical protein
MLNIFIILLFAVFIKYYFFINKTYDKCDLRNVNVHKVIFPNNTNYNKYAHQFSSSSGGNHTHTIVPIIYCNTEKEVVNIINFARECNYKISTRSGGHSYVGNSKCNSNNCLQVDVSGINNIKLIDKKNNIIQAGPGVLLRNVVNFLILHRMTFPHGICKNVALGGHLQSSAWGILAYVQGSGLDYVESFRLVTSDGLVEEVSNKTNLNLYKAVLGSAPGSWGVITEYKVRGMSDNLYPNSQVISYSLNFDKNILIKVFDIYKKLIYYREKYNKSFMISLNIGNIPYNWNPDIPIISIYNDWYDKKYDYNASYVIDITLIWSDISKIPININNYFKKLDVLKPISLFNNTLPLSIISSAATTFDHTYYLYHLHSIHSNYIWSDEFINLFIN